MTKIIGEVSANHGGNKEGIETSINELKSAGCDIVKFQLYTCDSITIPLREERFLVKDGPWSGSYLVDIYKKGGLDYELFRHAVEYGRNKNIKVIASVFDIEAADLCLELNIDIVKIASAEAWDIDLITYCLERFELTIVSLGMASIDDLNRIYDIVLKNGFLDKVVFMHCISGYPAKSTEYKLANIKFIKENYNTNVGLSDHTIGNEVAMLSVALGATWFEKHFIPSNVKDSLDEHFSANKENMQSYVSSIKRTNDIISSANFLPAESEQASLTFRRGLYFNRSLKAGDSVTKDDLISRRPSLGLKPFEKDLVIGKKLKKDVLKFKEVQESDVE